MAFNVRIFGYKGIIQIQERMVKQYTAASVFLTEEPCEWSEVLSVTGAPITSTVLTSDQNGGAIICAVEVPDNQAIRYEIQPRGPDGTAARTAGNASRKLTGVDVFSWNYGFTISVVDALAFP